VTSEKLLNGALSSSEFTACEACEWPMRQSCRILWQARFRQRATGSVRKWRTW